MTRYDITDQDRELIAAALDVLRCNFDPSITAWGPRPD
jgi:hypothetical protein